MIEEMVAHQGGWDEILMVAGPLAVFAAVLVMANNRAKAKLAERAAAAGAQPAPVLDADAGGHDPDGQP